jgi:mRNA interferase RelE/StbE
LAANVEAIRPDALAGDLAGLYKLRVGDYRIAYQLLRSEQVIVVHLIGHRREVYRT